MLRVPADGGAPTILTKPAPDKGERDHHWPQFLPGARGVLFTVIATRGGVDAAQVALLDLRTNEQRILIRGGSHARYVPTGHLVYASGGALRAVAFDLQRLEVQSSPVEMVPGLLTTPFGAAEFDVAQDGTLVYAAGDADNVAARVLVWVDRQGQEKPISAPPRQYVYPRLSPDGQRIAVNLNDQELDIWMWDLARETLTRMSFDPGQDTYPIWMRDGRSLIFQMLAGDGGLFRRAADNTGALTRLGDRASPRQPTAVSPDGRWLLFTDIASSPDVMMTALDGSGEAVPLVRTPAVERNGVVSPDGRWLAYESDASGRAEVYVRPFPDTTSGYWQVSTSGGTRPLWSPRGDELFYRTTVGALMKAAVDRGVTWSASTPVTLFPFGAALAPGIAAFPGRNYDISPDGQWFLMVKAAAARSGQSSNGEPLILVQNWTEELKRLVPAN